MLLTSFAEYQRRFGGYLSELEYGPHRYLPNAVEQFFSNGGSTCYVIRTAPKVITALGTLPEVTPEVIEGLFVADMEFLQDMYDTINKADGPQVQVTRPHCGQKFVDTINFQGAG